MASYLNLKPVDFDKLSAKRQAAVQWKGRILLPKYDGCLAIVLFNNGMGERIISRDNKPVRSMDHIYEDIKLRYPGLASSFGRWAVIGEAWIPGQEFAVISGAYRRHSPQRQLGFAPFDVVNWQDGGTPLLYSDSPYKDRVELLRRTARHIVCNVYPPLPVECEDGAHAIRYARYLKDLGGYDGAIASDPDAPYVVSDGYGEFLKIKPLLSYTLEVVGVERSKGEKTGRDTCALVVRFKGTTCKVGTGLSEAEQASPEQFIGKLIEVQCMAVYPGEQGLMREPRFVGVRDDVLKADY